MVRPLLKWAGGKRQLLHEIVEMIPPDFEKYWEPFMGGAALFFAIAQNTRWVDQEYVLSDINPDLCLLYNTVKDRPVELIEYLESLEFRNNSADYYEARSTFNSTTGKNNPVEKSGLLLYLNRHCFNGLYRVNSKGEFNVPFGSYISPKIPSRDHIIGASECLNKSVILNDDFQSVLSKVKKHDFVYLDPPYEPLSSSSSFTAYSSKGFDRNNQLRLSHVLKELDRKGVNFLLSNSGNSFLKELYDDFHIKTVEARRNINSVGSKRGTVKEILVTNY